jgi:hypothetical protein
VRPGPECDQENHDQEHEGAKLRHKTSKRRGSIIERTAALAADFSSPSEQHELCFAFGGRPT